MTTHVAPETELVLSLCCTSVSAEVAARVRTLLAQPLDWNAVLRRAESWELEAVVFSNLRSTFGEAIPPKVLDKITVLERESRARALSRTLVTIELVSRLESSGIKSILMKGPAIGVVAYGDPSLRSFDDVDLLVRKQDLVRARDLLISFGYEKQYVDADESFLIDQHHALEFSNSRLKVELHSALVERHLRLSVPEPDLWAVESRVSCAGGSVRVLAPHYFFVFLCSHGAKHEWERPRWVRDIAQLLTKVDPDAAGRIIDTADGLHARRILALGLRLAASMFGADISAFPASRMVPDGETRELVELVLARARLIDYAPSTVAMKLSRHDPNIAPLFFWVAARERYLDRVACVAHVLLVPTASDNGPRALKWARRPVRLAARLLWGAARA